MTALPTAIAQTSKSSMDDAFVSGVLANTIHHKVFSGTK
jgi:hypothetical protein